MEGCLGCDVNEGRIEPPGGFVIDDELWVADHELTPLMRGYLILKPRRHVHYFADLTDDEAASFGPTLRALLRAMQAVLDAERIYVNSFAETVHHLHFHLIPRDADMPALGPELLPRVFGGEWKCSTQDAAAAADEIRRSIVSSASRVLTESSR